MGAEEEEGLNLGLGAWVRELVDVRLVSWEEEAD